MPNEYQHIKILIDGEKVPDFLHALADQMAVAQTSGLADRLLVAEYASKLGLGADILTDKCRAVEAWLRQHGTHDITKEEFEAGTRA